MKLKRKNGGELKKTTFSAPCINFTPHRDLLPWQPTDNSCTTASEKTTTFHTQTRKYVKMQQKSQSEEEEDVLKVPKTEEENPEFRIKLSFPS